MERKGGAATIALLLATVLGVSFFPRSGSQAPSGSETAKPGSKSAFSKTEKSVTSKELKPLAACVEIARRLQRFARQEGPNRITAQDMPKIDSCYADGLPITQLKSPISPYVHFAIALVPNPVQTHLPLMFDRSIEAIQQAAQDQNFTYDSSWFPWNQRDKSFDSLSDQERAEEADSEQQRQPGILVFRRGYDDEAVKDAYKLCKDKHGDDSPNETCQVQVNAQDLNLPYKEGLIVFVVAEQPTGGISDQQFEHAMDWLEKLQP